MKTIWVDFQFEFYAKQLKPIEIHVLLCGLPIFLGFLGHFFLPTANLKELFGKIRKLI